MAEKALNQLENTQSYVHHLVWLDNDIENLTEKSKVNQLRELDDKIKYFTDEEQCVDYIRKQDDKNTKSYIIFITSGAFSEEIIPQIHKCICIVAIFIFCTNPKHFQHVKSPKLRAICTDIHELYDRIGNCMNRDQVSIDFSLFNNQKVTESGKFNRILHGYLISIL
jgi:hypothetical protein